MPSRDLKTLPQMNADSLQYLAENTDITYLSEGSIARALVEATNSEISKIQEYIVAGNANSYLNSASGFYLDLFGQMLSVKRLPASAGSSSAEDQNVQFSVPSGVLGDKFPHPGNLNQGKIQAGVRISTLDGSIVYRVAQDTVFPRTARQVFVPVTSDQVGQSYRVGKNKLVVHNGPTGVNVTNLKSIDNASTIEPDSQYRYRLANSILAQATGNETSVKLAAIGSADISTVILQEFSRGAGTFDALLVPVGNSVSFRTAEITKRAIDRVAAFGISSKVREPDYIKFKISVQLIQASGSGAGSLDVNRINAKSSILNHFESIRLGGELVINKLRADIIGSLTNDIKDIQVLELCLNGKPHSIRNIKLKPTQLFTPDNELETEAIQVV